MIITLELTSEIEAQLRTEIKRQDDEQIRQLLASALTPTVKRLLQETMPVMNDDDFERTADQLADILTSSLPPNTPSLSDYAVNRAGIYEEHP